jgi:DnaJ homolog subfamily C member 28
MSEPPRDERDHDDKGDSHPLRRVTQRSFESLIDQHIRAAEEAGEFRDLPGAGKPLKLDEDVQVPEELRTGFRMLKNAGYAPPWVELQKSIREEQERLAAWLAQSNRRWPGLGQASRDELRAEYERRLRDLNRLISSYNLTAPPVAGQMPLLQVPRELHKLGE